MVNSNIDDFDALKDRTRKLIEGSGLAVLASIMDDSPHQGLVAFAVTEDLRSVLFATPVYTRKYENIKKNAEISLLVDNRTDSELDFQRYASLGIRGTAVILDEGGREEYMRVYLTRHPYMEDFLRAPTTALILVKVSMYTLVSSFQHVQEWRP